MNITSFFAFAPRLGRLLATAAAVFAMGLLYPPAVRVAHAATTPVAVDQQPLSIRQTVPPDITLMLDDSGSMAWDFMPDECNGSTAYLDGVSCDSNGNATITNNDALISSSNNGVYYNPAVNYALPVNADGTSWPAANFTSALTNGFNAGGTTRNLTTYHNFNAANASNNYGNGTGNIGYSQSFTVTTSGTPYSPNNCPSGYSLVGAQCQKQNYTAYCPSGTALQTGTTNTGKCKSGNGSKATYFYPCGGTDTYVSLNTSKTGDICSPNPPQTSNPTCNTGDTFDPGTGLCTPPGATRTISFFTYSVRSGSTYTDHYVGLTGTCALAVAAGDMTAANCDESAGTQLNVANWFSYYHTRILMAKSSLMIAFSQVDPSFRIGFGSIDGNNFSTTMGQNGTVSFTTSVPWNGSTISYSTGIADVAPFDTNCFANPTTCTPGQSGTQRNDFWSWVKNESAGGGTPLRQALDQVGQYYQTSQPWTTMSTDPGASSASPPSNIACRQAYTILTTDGFWNDNFTPSPTDYTGASSAAWPTITGSNSQTWPIPTGSSPAAPYSGGAADSGPSLADVAMYYWENDLQDGSGSSTNIPNNVPPSATDPAFWQHMTTFTIGLGFTPTGITPTGTTIGQIFGWANGGTAPSNFAWPTPSANSINNIADLAHAGVNGHGGFFSATDPNSFVNGLITALNRATDRVGTGASLAANSTQLQTGTAVFQANYYTGNWKGGLKELAVNANTGAIAISPTWSAQTQLANSVCTAVTDSNGNPTGAITCDNRKIQTYNPATGTFVAFKNTGSGSSATPPALSSTQLTALGPDATTQANIVNYLRGNSTLEEKNGGSFRSRDWPLGDIVDSQPVYEGAPDANQFINTTFVGYTTDPNNPTCTSCSPFQNWAVGTTDSNNNFTPSAASQRAGVVWVAGNDGMLHGFNATTGNEIYAYLPGALMVNSTDPVTGKSNPLANLANPAYGNTATPHQFYNDGELTVVDAYVKLTQSGDTGPQWHTVLVGTTGRGPARAVYALDVTDPTNVTPLWERYAGDSSSLDSNSGYIGQMVGKPVIAQTGDYGTTPSWSVLIGNGYNSPNGSAALLQFDLATGQLYVHTTTDTSDGLAAPLVWQDYPSAFMSDVAYAGDLHGNVWSFPLMNVSTGNGNNATTTYTPTPSAAGVKLFTAMDSTGKVQPITASPWAAQVPSTAQTADNPNSVWLFFGTGKYLTQSDVNDQSVQSWYGIMAQTTAGNGPVNAFTRADSKMVTRSIIAEQAATSSQLAVRAVTQPTPAKDPYSTTDMTGMKGWVMDLTSPGTPRVAQGERMVVPNQLQGNLLIGTTRIPKPTGDISDPCNPAGSGWIMAVNPFSGTGPVSDFFDTNGDGKINSGDEITLSNGTHVPAAGVGFTSLPNAPIFIGGDMLLSFDNGSTATDMTNSSSGTYSRVSWQELITP